MFKPSKVYSDYVGFVQSKSLRGRSKAEYLRQVRKLAERHPQRSLKQLSERTVLDHLIYLRDEQKQRPSTLNQAVVALRLCSGYGVRRQSEATTPLLVAAKKGWKRQRIPPADRSGRTVS